MEDGMAVKTKIFSKVRLTLNRLIKSLRLDINTGCAKQEGVLAIGMAEELLHQMDKGIELEELLEAIEGVVKMGKEALGGTK